MVPKLIPIWFLNLNAARRAIKKNVPKNQRKFHKAVRGNKLKDVELEYIPINKGTWGKFLKYDYPDEAITQKQRQDYRTVIRRRLRRMGLYTRIGARKKVWEKPTPNKLVKNTQKVSHSPNTSARAFGLERKNKNIRYVWVRKLPPVNYSNLATLKVIRIDLRNGNYSIMKLNIKKTDIIIPYIMAEIIKDLENFDTHRELIKLFIKNKIPCR